MTIPTEAELVEKVARAIAAVDAYGPTCGEDWKNYLAEANAAIPLVREAERERCARVVERIVNEGNGDPDWPVADLADVAAAIRKGEV